MTRKTAVYLPLTFLCGALLLAQNLQPTDGNWTDQNNTEQYAAYLLETTYYQQGYCGARVEIKQDGSKRLFIVEPGVPTRKELCPLPRIRTPLSRVLIWAAGQHAISFRECRVQS
jgi:hypothetical protein